MKRRVARILEVENVDPERVLAVTFSRGVKWYASSVMNVLER